jgi:hypothetical protein
MSLPHSPFIADHGGDQELSSFAANRATALVQSLAQELSFKAAEPAFLHLLDEVYGSSSDPAVFEHAAQGLIARLQRADSLGLRFEVESGAEMSHAAAAYAAVGNNGAPTIYLNADWAASATDEQLRLVLLEEIGHHFDTLLNGEIDTAGDEGELFAKLFSGIELSAEERAAIEAEDDSTTLTIDGVEVGVEQAVANNGVTSPSALGSNALGTSYTTPQTIGPTKAALIPVRVAINNNNNDGADILIAAYQGTTLIGWSVYDRATNLDGNTNSGVPSVPGPVILGFNLSQFNTSLTAGNSSNGLVIRAWQGTFNGTSTTDEVDTATTSGTGSSVAFTPNALTYSSNTTVSGSLTSGFESRGWAVSASDLARPTIAISSNVSSLKAGETATITFTLSEASTNFTSADVTVSGGTLSGFSGSGTSYTATFTPTADSTANGVISVASGTFSDAAGNTNNDGADVNNSVTLTVDTQAPTVTITDSDAGIVNIADGTVTFTFTFSEAVTGFDATKVTVGNGTKGTFSGSGSTYTLVVTPTASSTGDITVDVSTTGVTDAAGNQATAPAQYTQAFDTQAPTVTITDSDAGIVNIADGTVTFTFTFSEAVTGFDATKVMVGNGTKGTFSGSGSIYTLVVTPTASSTGDITVDVSTTGVTDAAGNQATAPAQYTQAFDTQAPTAPSFALASDTGSSNSDGITNIGTVTVSGIESNATWQYSTDSGSTWSTGSGTSFTLAEATYPIGMIRVRQTDLAGNTSTSFQNSAVITVDLTAPTTTANVTGVTEGAGGPSLTNGGTSNVTAPLVSSGTLTAPLNANETIRVSDGSTFLGNATVTGTSWVYTDRRPLAANQTVTYSAQIADAAGNQSALGTTFAVTQTSLAPVISVQDVSLLEGNSGSKSSFFRVLLSRTSSQAISLNYQFTGGGTATLATDYTAVAGIQTLTFAPGVIAQDISFTVNGDTTNEPDETFVLQLSSPVNATFAGASTASITTTGTIFNDDSTTIPPISSFGNFEGSTGDDVLIGLGGANQINGLAGNDTITGGAGADALAGSTGADTFVYTTFADSVLNTMDAITDFNSAAGDKIDVTTVPTQLFNRGSVVATTLEAALQQVYSNKTGEVPAQPLLTGEAIVFTWALGGDPRRTNTYVSISDGLDSNFSGDLLVRLPSSPGAISLTTFI